MPANLAASCNPNADCHSNNANDAAVIAHEPAIAAQAIRSPCCRQREPTIAATAATTGGATIHRLPGAQVLRICQQ